MFRIFLCSLACYNVKMALGVTHVYRCEILYTYRYGYIKNFRVLLDPEVFYELVGFIRLLDPTYKSEVLTVGEKRVGGIQTVAVTVDTGIAKLVLKFEGHDISFLGYNLEWD